MLFPTAVAQVLAPHDVKIGENTVTFHIGTPSTVQRMEDEDNQIRAKDVRVHRIRCCVKGWEGLEDDRGPVGFTIHKLFELWDVFPEVLTELKKLIDPMFA